MAQYVIVYTFPNASMEMVGPFPSASLAEFYAAVEIADDIDILWANYAGPQCDALVRELEDNDDPERIDQPQPEKMEVAVVVRNALVARERVYVIEPVE